MRHWDHKFEWNRNEFKVFCKEIYEKYNYAYEISGIGEHISDHSLGHASQMALF